MIIQLVTVVHLFICVFLVLIVLLQHGKGADMGASFGGGSQTLFGASGADNLLTRVTTGLAGLFMITSLILALNAYKIRDAKGNLFNDVPQSTDTAQKPASPTDQAKPATAPEQKQPEQKQAEVPAAEQKPAAAPVATVAPVTAPAPQQKTAEAPATPSTAGSSDSKKAP